MIRASKEGGGGGVERKSIFNNLVTGHPGSLTNHLWQNIIILGNVLTGFISERKKNDNKKPLELLATLNPYIMYIFLLGDLLMNLGILWSNRLVAMIWTKKLSLSQTGQAAYLSLALF